MEYTVTEINNELKSIITKNFKNDIYITGEITNLGNNKAYFRLKEGETQNIECVFFNNCENIKNGDKVKIKCKVDYYEKSGKSQVYVKNIMMLGIGDIKKKQEEIKLKYEKLGYFNNKKPLPLSVKNIGIITSSSGAVIEDIKKALNDNYFNGNIFLYNCNVQGIKCPQSVADGINFFEDNEEYNVEIIIIARGGGSFEDLFGYSHPLILEALYNSSKYTISAIGHEDDRMLSDDVANYRCPTPSIAGYTIANINKNKINELSEKINKIKYNILDKLNKYKEILWKTKNIIGNNPVIEYIKKIENYASNIKENIIKKLNKYKNDLKDIKAKVNFHNTDEILNYDFNILVDSQGNVIKKNKYNREIFMIDKYGKHKIIIKKIES